MNLETVRQQHGCLHRTQFDGPAPDEWIAARPDVWVIRGHETRWTFEASALLAVDPTVFGPNPRAVLSHVSATHLYDAGVLTGPYHVTSTLPDSGHAADTVVHHTANLPAWVRIDGIPVTSAAQTAADIAATCDADHAGRVIHDLIRRQHATRDELEQRLGARTVAELLDEHQTNSGRH